ncbi:hypothetical protein [Lewinella sp. IMCC34183]|uniref:hypothetical protein n=1 Tax=Lewinella sp. IMCC34183 TaxID=2248762 RepID=UPI000E24F0CD|nr:hypothetical protein [Lewinella sp. IMCC34183]
MSLQPSLNILLAQRLLPGFDSRLLVTWAADALSDGYGGEGLVRLARMERSTPAARMACFSACVADLGLSTCAEPHSLLQHYAFYLARRVVRRKIDGFEGLEKLKSIYVASDYDSRYQAFYLLAEDLAALRAGGVVFLTKDLSADNGEELVLRTCTEFLSWESVNINPHRWGAVYCFSCHHVDAPVESGTWLSTKTSRPQCRLCGSRAVGSFSEEADRSRILAAAARGE